MIRAFLFAGAFFTALTLPAIAAAPPLPITYGNVNEVFIDFLLAGCMPAAGGRTLVADFAMLRQLTRANDEISAVFLHGEQGAVYVHGGHAVVITANENGSCTVLARRAPEMELIKAVEKWLIGPGSGFTKTSTEENRAADGLSTTRVYQSMTAGKTLLAVMTTTERDDVLAQAIITVGLDY